jgi:uncharacterized membrane protein
MQLKLWHILKFYWSIWKPVIIIVIIVVIVGIAVAVAAAAEVTAIAE